MKTTSLITAAGLALAITTTPAGAQHVHGGAHSAGSPHLHTSSRWKECSFQLDASLTKEAWQQFTRERPSSRGRTAS